MVDRLTPGRGLSPDFEADLAEGVLAPLLEVVRRDRDLILEMRDDVATIYCKGQQLARLSRQRRGYAVEADSAFWSPPEPLVLESARQTGDYVRDALPHVKQRIACHAKGGGAGGALEIEIEQLLIRFNNNEAALNTEYFCVDRQVALSAADRLDVVGVHWPRNGRNASTELGLALIEVKYSLGGGVEGILEQVRRYHDLLAADMERVAAQTQALLRQKLRLGLITGASPAALDKLATLPVSRDPATVRVVLALADYNPYSSRLDLDALRRSPLARHLDLFFLGFGMWTPRSALA